MRRLGFVALLFVPIVVHAQFALPGFQGALRLTMTPQNPSPNSTVNVSLESALIDLDTSTVAWSVDGKPVPGDRSIVVETGGLGTTRSITARVTTDAGSILQAETDVIPTEVDLLYDSDTYTHPLYKGRALPSAGARLTLQAIPHFIKKDGGEVAAKDIVFTWKRNGRVLGDISGRGRSVAFIDAPLLYGTDVITVDAASASETLYGSASVTIPSRDPVIRLYEDHPLFGLRFERALGENTSLSDREMTFAAVPFYAPVSSPSDPSLVYGWTVDDKQVSTSGDTKHELTIGAADGGSARLGLNLTHSTNIFFGAGGAWQITFGSQLDADNPFISR